MSSQDVDCPMDYQGTLVLKNNQMGAWARDSLIVTGLEHFKLERNVFDVIDRSAIAINNAQNVIVENNRFAQEFMSLLLVPFSK